MENIRFKAINIQNDVENNVLMVGLYDHQHFFSVQLTLPPAADLLPQHLNSYLVERDDPAFASRMGVEQIILKSTQLIIKLNDDGKNDLQCAGITVDFEIDPMCFLELKIALIVIFKDLFLLDDE